MARPLRVEYPGAVYHLTSRGNARQLVFMDDEDREAFLHILEQVIDRYRWICHSYCLMGNHYHLLVEILENSLSEGMRQLNGVYTQRFNRKRHRVGHLFQGRFKAILVEREAHLLELCRYVVLNPVRAGVTQHPAGWQWSSYRATVGAVVAPKWLTTDWLLAQFDHHPEQARRAYQEFVVGAEITENPWEQVRGQVYLGSEAFCERVASKVTSVEVPRLQRQPVRPPLDHIFSVGTDRCRQALDAYREYGYKLHEIATFLGVHYATVSRWIKFCESKNSNGHSVMLECKT